MDGSNVEKESQLKPSSGWVVFLQIGVASFGASGFKEIFEIPYALSYGVLWWIGVLIEYWIPPSPPTSFLGWLARVTVLALGLVLCLWLIPSLLTDSIWKPLAYGLPTFALFVFSYWLYPITKKATLKDMTLVGLMAAVIFGTVMYFD